MTNMVYRCGLQEDGKETQLVLMRVHASASDLFDRAAEVATFRSVSAAGLGPRLLLLFGNGRVEQFLARHVTLAAPDLHEPAVSAAIAHAVAHFHARMSEALAGDPHHQGPVQLWGRLRAWQQLAQQHCSAAELQQMGMAGLEDEITQLQQALCCAHPCWVAACHNDLQYGNIMAPAAAAAGSDAAAAAADGVQQGLGGLRIDAAEAAGAAAAGHTAATADALQQHQHQTAVSSSSSTGRGTTAACSAAAAAAGPAAAADSSSGAARAHSLDALPAAAAGSPGVAALAGSSSLAAPPAQLHKSGSGSSLNLRGRSGANMQLPDGSLVLPGMKARPRGHSPDASGGRPEPFSKAAAAAAAGGGGGAPGLGGPGVQRRSSGGSGMQAAAAAAAGSGGAAAVDGGASAASVGARALPEAAAAAAAAGSGGGAAVDDVADAELEAAAAADAAGLQPPSAAAVLRHAPSADELFVSAGTPGASGAAAAAAAAAAPGRVRRRGRISSSGLSTSESAADSEDADAILPPPLPTHTAGIGPPAPDAAVAGGGAAERSGSSSGGDAAAAAAARRPVEDDGMSEVAADAAAAAARDAGYYRRLRRRRRQPAAGIEFPTFRGSDGDGSSGSGSSSGDDAIDGDGAGDAGAAAACAVDGSSSGGDAERRRDDRSGAGGGGGIQDKLPAATAAAAAAASAGISGRGAPADGGAGSSAPAADAPEEAPGPAPPVALTLIDYEYSGFNPVAFDIANHWCEWAADYHTRTPHVLDFAKAPDARQRRAFVEAYLTALLGGLGISIADGDAAGAGAVGHAAAEVRFAGAVEAAPGGGLRLGARGSAGGCSAQDDHEADERGSVEGLGTSWSVMSSRGGSALSMPVDTDAATYADSSWDAASETADTASLSSSRGGGGWQPPPHAPAGDAGTSPGAAATAAEAAAAAAELRSVWAWLERHQPDRRLLANTRQLDAACFGRLAGALTAASGAYMAASHLLWALWGVIQSRVSDVDFDFEGYGVQRWQQYLATRPAGLQRK
ncbi:Choline/ethanolamine kinase-domain-containing protein [Scenedesmus sp. NREL 46B-D3]|nr:Choline/ethanolamine kinase-domain-containing protein [Scenedesmus sp. NREL 46B-D3]